MEKGVKKTVSCGSSISSTINSSVIRAALCLFLICNIKKLKEMILRFLLFEPLIFFCSVLQNKNCNQGLFLWLIWLLICLWLNIISILNSVYFLNEVFSNVHGKSSKVKGEETKHQMGRQSEGPNWSLQVISIDLPS
jgi:hypothetical protein